MFLHCSTCFERHTAHHQELKTVIAASGFTHVCGCRQLPGFELLMMSGVSLETCWAIKKHWNNKFYYTVASCCTFLYDLYYDARSYEYQVYKLIISSFLAPCQMRALFFWDVTHCWLLVTYRRFGTASQSYLKWSSSLVQSFWTILPLKMRPIGSPETSVIISGRCVTSKKSENLKLKEIIFL
jgi:hypothetical protein